MADLLDRVYDTITQGAVLVGTALGVDMRDAAPPSPPFRVEEVIDGATGKIVYTVTDGAGSSCDCATREQADAVLDALEGKETAVVRGRR